MAEIDFTGFLLAHRCMRREYGRLAKVAHHPRDVSHETLVEKQITVSLSLLHHHHLGEDSWLWPTLRTRAPQAVPALDRLEAQHAQIDPLVIAAADTTRPLPERAPVLAQLHQVINAHLDEEERVVLPLCSAHVSAEEWDAFEQRTLASIPRRHLPIVLAWTRSETSAAEWTHVKHMLPRLMRVLLTMIWAPAYAKRRHRLYGQCGLPLT